MLLSYNKEDIKLYGPSSPILLLLRRLLHVANFGWDRFEAIVISSFHKQKGRSILKLFGRSNRDYRKKTEMTAPSRMRILYG